MSRLAQDFSPWARFLASHPEKDKYCKKLYISEFRLCRKLKFCKQLLYFWYNYTIWFFFFFSKLYRLRKITFFASARLFLAKRETIKSCFAIATNIGTYYLSYFSNDLIKLYIGRYITKKVSILNAYSLLGIINTIYKIKI